MQHSAIKAYGDASLNLGGNKSQEIEAVTRITAELERAEANPDDLQGMFLALNRNQKMWNIFLVALADESHPYTVELRAELISFGIWVNRHTQKVLKSRKGIDKLIELNKDLLAGLTNESNQSGAQNTAPQQQAESAQTPAGPYGQAAVQPYGQNSTGPEGQQSGQEKRDDFTVVI